MSPFLFVIVMDAFNRMLGATIGSGLLSGFMVGGPKKAWLWVFHLFLADDTLLFGDVYRPSANFASSSALFRGCVRS